MPMPGALRAAAPRRRSLSPRRSASSCEVGDPIEHIQRLGGKIANARPSMLLDHLAQRRSEIDVINGSIPRLGAKAGVATPVNATVVALVKARESRFPT